MLDVDAVAVTTTVAFADSRILVLQLESILFSLTHRFVYELQLFTERVKVFATCYICSVQ
jgi:hypothetical protein